MQRDVIRVKDLVKVYSNGTVALRGISISIERGIIFSLLGRNGAGKTTFVRIVSTQLMPTHGEVRVFGYDAVKEVKEIRERIAVMPQEALPQPFLTPLEHVYYYLRLRGMSKEKALNEAKKWLKELGLWEYRNKPTVHLSGGLKRRVLLAMVLASEAELLILDEPTVGLDPLCRRITWDYIRQCKKAGKTILLTTHYIDEAEVLSDKLAIIDKGKILIEGSIDSIKRLIKARYTAIVEGIVNAEELKSYGEVLRIKDSYLVYINDIAAAEELVKNLLRRGISIRVHPTSLEDVFIRLVRGGSS